MSKQVLVYSNLNMYPHRMLLRNVDNNRHDSDEKKHLRKIAATLDQTDTHTHTSAATSEPLGVMLDGAQSWTVPKAAVDDRINGQEVCHRGCKQIPL